MVDVLRDEVTNLIFRLRIEEQPEAPGGGGRRATPPPERLWNPSQFVHQQEMAFERSAKQKEAAIAGSQRGGEQAKAQPIRKSEPKVGRNDVCPCGSGKKYKKCHGKIAS